MPNLKTIHRDLQPPLARLPVLLNILASQSRIVTRVLREAKLLETWGVSVYDERLLQKLANDVILRRAGAYFAHVLVPHSPQVFLEDCSIDYSSEPWTRWNAFVGLIGNSEESRKIRYGRIVPQMKCAMTLLERLFNKLKQAGLYEAATIVVHGDHGTSAYLYSPSIYNMKNSYQRDFLEAFSTLFAIKWPGGSFKRIDDVEPLNILLEKVAIRMTGLSAIEMGIERSQEAEPFVYLTGEEKLRKVFVNIFADPAAADPSLNSPPTPNVTGDSKPLAAD